MKLQLVTTYENIDQEWIDWWLEYHGANYGIEKDNIESGEGFVHMMRTKDPTSPAIGTTTITFVCEPQESLVPKGENE